MSLMKRLYRLSQEERGAIREQLATELSREPDVFFAYLYGSFVEGETFHDVDIGVYVSTSYFNNAMAANLSAHLSDKVKLPVDVRILNAAPVSFRFHVLRGTSLFSRDDDLRTDIMEETTAALFRHRPDPSSRHQGGLRRMTLNPELDRRFSILLKQCR